MRDAGITIGKGMLGTIPSFSYFAFLRTDDFTAAFQVAAGFFSACVSFAMFVSLLYDIRRKRRRDREERKREVEMDRFRKKHIRKHPISNEKFHSQ